ncbi:hypothetical protein TWF481_007566 [Arthrobotrys musiformis]|uniref:Uncharacterized protein n=1 Tax=Arthrobotrys musiformis TaxID=47236 RepID=A0AAV9WBU2_9PEZI
MRYNIPSENQHVSRYSGFRDQGVPQAIIWQDSQWFHHSTKTSRAQNGRYCYRRVSNGTEKWFSQIEAIGFARPDPKYKDDDVFKNKADGTKWKFKTREYIYLGLKTDERPEWKYTLKDHRLGKSDGKSLRPDITVKEGDLESPDKWVHVK